MPPTLSIIVPFYNAGEYIPACIESIFSQTFTDYELILVDDGSTDNSGTICDSYALKDNRVKVIHKVHGGTSSARNAGLNAALGKYIGWVDADDRIAPDMYEKLYCLTRTYDTDIADCQYYIIEGERTTRSGNDEPVVYGDSDFIMKEFFNARMKPGLTTKLYKKELWKDIYFPEGRKHQDCYVNMRFALMPLVYARTPQPLYYYIVRENSITTTYSSFEIRQAFYLFDYTMSLAESAAKSNQAKAFLVKDAINRLMGRYFEVSINSNIKDQVVYNHYLRKKLGSSLIKYLLLADLPLKTRISYILLVLNMKSLQIYLHNHLGKSRQKIPAFIQINS